MVFVLLGGVAGSLIFASDITPVLEIGNKSNEIAPLFTEDLGYWYPGYCATKSLKIKNIEKIDTVIKGIGMKIVISKDGSNIGDSSMFPDTKTLLRVKSNLIYIKKLIIGKGLTLYR